MLDKNEQFFILANNSVYVVVLLLFLTKTERFNYVSMSIQSVL